MTGVLSSAVLPAEVAHRYPYGYAVVDVETSGLSAASDRVLQVAVAHLILVSAYWMLTRDEPYRDLGADWLARRNDEAHARRLVAQLERLGHTVVLDQPAA